MAREIDGIEAAGDEAILSVPYEVGRASGIGDDARQSAGEGFDHDVAVGVGGAWEEKEICRGVSLREFGALEVASEDCAREFGAKLVQIGPVSDDGEGDRELFEQGHYLGEEVEVLFL